MLTLADRTVQRSLTQRILGLRPDAKARWGRMSSHQAICHLSDSFRVCMGEKAASMVPAPAIQRLAMKWIALYVPIPWPKGIPTRPEVDQFAGGTAPVEFETDRLELLALMERFAETGRRTSHPMFGDMKQQDWMRWAYLHMNHHLRQFGA